MNSLSFSSVTPTYPDSRAESYDSPSMRRRSPEAEIVLLCARTTWDDAATCGLAARLAAGLDWGEVVRLVREHGVAALVFRSLDGVRPGLVPMPVLDDLRGQFYAVTARNLLFERELLQIVRLLEGHGIPVIPFKGPLLAQAAYGSGSLREYVDLDILVPRRDLRRARALLHQRGYRPILTLDGFARTAYRQSECALDLMSQDESIVLELHWDLMPRYFSLAFDLDQVWREHRWQRIGQETVRSLSLPDLLVFLCVHGTKHRWEQLRWICDVAELIRAHPDLDWDAVVGRARQVGAERMLLLGLLLAADLLAARPPSEIIGRAEGDPVVVALARTVCARLFDPEDERFAARNLFYVRAMERRWQRLRYCLHVGLIPTKAELAARSLPPTLSILHYPLHSLGLIGQALAEVGARTPLLAHWLPSGPCPAHGAVTGRPRHAHH